MSLEETAMLRKKYRPLPALLAALVLILSTGMNVLAADLSVDLSQAGSITIALQDKTGSHTPIAGAEFTLYQIADVEEKTETLTYRFTSDFAGCGANLSDLSAGGLADHLAGYATAKKLTGAVNTTNSEGKVVFSKLPVGLYLLVQSSNAAGYFPTAPFLVSIPMTNTDGTGWIYDVDASPKAQPKPDPGTPDEDDTKLIVKKEWDGEDENRPDHVTVHLLRDGEIYDTIVLNDENGWKHKWDGLDSNYRWSVFEDEVPEGYTVSYSGSEFTITITNSTGTTVPGDPEDLTVIKVWEDDEEKQRPAEVTIELWNKDGLYDTIVLSETNEWRHTWTDLPEGLEWEAKEINPPEHYTVSYSRNGNIITVKNTSTDETLIQTGQLNWPIPLMAGAGILLFAIGWILVFVKRDRHEA